MNKHTDGVWYIEVSPSGIAVHGRNIDVANVGPIDDKSEAIANAKLIAAAPLLLSTLKSAAVELSQCSGNAHLLGKIEAALEAAGVVGCTL